MSNLVIVLGKSGTGKSTSVKSLNPKETVIFNTLGKRLPFKGSNAVYNEANKNLFKIHDYTSILAYLDSIDKKAPHVKNVVIDDATYVMRMEFFDRSKERGFDKYNELADHFRSIIQKCNSLRDDLNIFMMLHTDTEESDGSIVSYKAASVGKLIDKMFNPLENVTITLFSQPKYDDKGKPTFGFYTHNLRDSGIEIPAKTPEGMFEDDFIPNDLQIVVDKMNEFYN